MWENILATWLSLDALIGNIQEISITYLIHFNKALVVSHIEAISG
jgi:hypothetical protein